jgi:hypothetical protein
MEPVGLPWECLDRASKGPQWGPLEDFNGAPRRAPQKRESKKYLARDLRGHKAGSGKIFGYRETHC